MNCQVRRPSSGRRLSTQIGRLKEQREMVLSSEEEEEVDEEDNGQNNMIGNYGTVNGVETDLKQVVTEVEVEDDSEGKSDGITQRRSDSAPSVVSTAVAVGEVGNCDTGKSTRPDGYLTPDLHLVSPPSFPKKGGNCSPCIVGRYILLDQLDDKPLYKCVNIDNELGYTCKIVNNENQQALALHHLVDSHECLNELVEVLVGERHSYLFFDRSYGDLHSYVRNRRRLKETEAVKLFRQVVLAVQHCHNNGIVLRDLKLRKFVFKDVHRTQLKLETLEDAISVDEDNDTLDDKHGCPAYVSPEILTTNGGYSGKAADVWSMGVMLYAMLVGRYPFHDTEHNTLFNKIRGGHYIIPDTISSKAKCLIRCLLRHNPTERLTVNDILRHPWFNNSGSSGRVLEARCHAMNGTNTSATTSTSVNTGGVASNVTTTNLTTGANKFGDQMVPDCGVVLVASKKPTGWE